MSDEQRVRSALEYDLEPWQPNASELMRRGKRLAWLRRGLAAAGVTALAGTVATVSAAVGGPTAAKNLLAGDGKPSVPAVVPAETPTPSVDPTCLPGKPTLPKATISVHKTIDPNQPPSVKPSLPGKPTVPSVKPSLPGTPSIPAGKPTLPNGTPSLPHGTPSLPPKPTDKPSFPTGQPSIPTNAPTLPGTPSIPSDKPSLPSVKPTLPTTKPTLPSVAVPSELPSAKPSVPAATPTLPDCVHGVPSEKPSAPAPKPTLPGKPSLPTPSTKPSAPKPAVPTVTVSGGVKVTVDPGKQPSIPTTKPSFPTTKPSIPTDTPSFPTGHPSSPNR